MKSTASHLAAFVLGLLVGAVAVSKGCPPVPAPAAHVAPPVTAPTAPSTTNAAPEPTK